MKQSVRFLNLEPSLCSQISELTSELPYTVSENGEYTVTVQKGEKLSIIRKDTDIVLTHSAPCEFFRALSLLSGVLDGGEDICESKKYKTLCYMADVSRNAVLNIPSAKRMIRYLALMGYTSMMLYTEDTYELPGHPYFGHMRGRYTAEELRELDDYAYGFGIELIPCVQTLAHLSTALRWPEFASYRDSADILLVGDDRTYTLVEDILKQISLCFRSRRIHIGMDEAHMLGRGAYLVRNGYRPAHEIMLEHLEKVQQLCRAYGFRPMMWSDMFFRMAFDGSYYKKEGDIPEDVIQKFPQGVDVVYWDYYNVDREILEHMFRCHQKFNTNVIFANGAWKWKGFCPQNSFSIDVCRKQLKVGENFGINEVIVTGWGDDGSEASQFSVLATLLYNAEVAYGKYVTDRLLDTRARQCLSASLSELLAFDLPNLLSGAPTEGRRSQCPSKYLLYNDPLERIMDCHLIPDTVCAEYTTHAERLMSLALHPTLGYAFETLGRLCRVLSVKADMGTRLYNAYQQGDKDTLKRIAAEDIPYVIHELGGFIKVFRKQWHTENKSFGFITQDIRLGGLVERMHSIKETLESYADGKTDKIEELEYAPLPLKGRPSEPVGSPYIDYNIWKSITAAGVM